MSGLEGLVGAGLAALVRLGEVVPDEDEMPSIGIAWLVVLPLIVATVLLWRNMGKQLGRIRFEDDPRPEPHDQPPPARGPRGPGD